MVAVCLAGVVVVGGAVVAMLTAWLRFSAASSGSFDEIDLAAALDLGWLALVVVMSGTGLGLGFSALVGPDRSTRARVLGALAVGVCGYALLSHLLGVAITTSTFYFD